jgi:hypothetical protein
MMTLEELYSALEEADKRAQAGDEEAKQDAIELASMIEQFKESTAPTQEVDEVSPIIVGTATGVAAGAKGATEMFPTAENIARANRIINPPAAPAAPNAPAATTPHGFHPGATSNAQFNAEQIEANKLLKPGNVPPGYKVEGNSRLIVPTTVDTQAKGTSPIIASKQEARQIALDKLKRGTTASGQFAGRVPGINVLGGGMAGYQGADAYNRAQRGDIPGAVISGTGSAGSAASTLLGKKHPIARIGGLGIGLVAPVINRAIDAQSAKEEKAMGGPVGYAAGKAVKGGLEATKKLFDPRFDKRVLEQQKLANQVLQTEKTGVKDIPKIYLPDYEGHGMVTSMSDRTAGGSRLLGVNDVKFNRPVELTGGQEYMYNNPGQAWASGKNPVNQIMREAVAMKKATGKDPLYMPWRMAPTASDFAHMTGETMLTHAQSAMGKAQKKDLDSTIKKFIPDWAGIDDPQSMEQFMVAPAKARKSIQNAIDRDLRGSGSLSIGQTRLAIADPNQLTAPEGGLMHVGRISADKPVIEASGNVTYPKGVPGEGVGQLEREHFVTEFLPDFVKERGIPDPRSPRQTDIRALQMKPYSGIIDDKLLKSLGYAAGGAAKKAAPQIISAAKKLILPPAENAARTQIIGTLPTYEKAGNILRQQGASGRGIDFGAGLGQGAKALGKDFDTYEPFAQNWKPTYSNAADVPSDEYGRLTNLNVLNVVPREVRDEIVQDIGRVMQPGGMGIITTRGKDVMNAKGLAGPEPMSVITSRDTYQKGFNKDELEEYLKYMLGDNFEIGRLNLGPAGAMIKKKAEGGLACMKEGGSTPAWQRAEGKNPEGGLNAAGRASYNRETGGNLKAPQPEGGSRKKSFCARMSGMKKKLTSSETANDPDSRINKSLRKWKC